MPRGFVPYEGGGNDFFDLKKDGDSISFILVDEPFILDIHNLNDPTAPYGKKMFPCGTKDRNACPICEAPKGQYEATELRTSIKAYYPVFVHDFAVKNGKPQIVNEMKVLSGGPWLHKGFMACFETLRRYDKSLINTPLTATRSGEDNTSSLAVQTHPDPEIKIEVVGETPDVEQMADAWLEKVWKEMGYNAMGGRRADSSPTVKEPDPPDPFDELPSANKKAA